MGGKGYDSIELKFSNSADSTVYHGITLYEHDMIWCDVTWRGVA